MDCPGFDFLEGPSAQLGTSGPITNDQSQGTTRNTTLSVLRTASCNHNLRDSFDGGDVDGGERFLSAFYMTVRCHLPSGERHRTVMQMLRSFGLP